MHTLIETLRKYPEIAIFLALALGFWFGNIPFGKFKLGAVTGVLLAGILIGQARINIPDIVKSTFFLMFLFAVGYGVGPQFFRGLKAGGAKQAIFAVLLAGMCLLCAVIMGKLLTYNAGLTAGLLSGSCTISAVLGVASDTINQLSIPGTEKTGMINAMPVAYAVTYIFGTAGSAWILSRLAPKILRVDLAQACKQYEAKLGGRVRQLGEISAYTDVSVRAYKVSSECNYSEKTAEELESSFSPNRVFVERIREGDQLIDAEPGSVIHQGQILAICSKREAIMQMEKSIGPEQDDRQLLDFPAEVLDVVLTNPEIAGKTIQDLAESEAGKREGRGVFLRKVIRSNVELPFRAGTELDRGDVLTLVGSHKNVEAAAALIGYADRATDATDITFMGLGIVAGALIGAITIHVGGVPLTISTSGGALIAGLICGWLRAVNRTFGRIPAPALWVFNNIGLTTFIAVVGITAGPAFIKGLLDNGLGLFLAGVVVTTVPFILGLLAGKYIFRFHPAINVGACAGARTTTAALGALEEVTGSKVCALGYTVPYAVGCILLTTWGVVIVLLLK